MRRVFRLASLAIAAGVVLPASLVAQFTPPSEINLSTSELLRLNIRPRANFLGPDWWIDLAPATYGIQVPDTNFCLELSRGTLPTEVEHIKLRGCQIENLTAPISFVNPNQVFEVSPAAVDNPPAPLFTNVRWRFTNVARCATKARGVVFGAPRVDWHGCEMTPSAGGDFAFIGAPDQSFFLFRRGQRGTLSGVPRYQIRGAERRCWTIEGGVAREGAIVLMEDCDGRAGQIFQFRYLGPLTDTANTGAADRFGWVPAPPISRAPNSADRYRDLPGININNAGYSTTATASDLGQECAATCRNDDNCSAFTWIPPRSGTGAMCRLTQSVTFQDLVDSPGTNSGIMRP